MPGLVVPTIECVESADNYGRFKAEPLEVGFGITLGNSLRRTLFSYILGAAVTRVRIEGVLHEFSVIPSAREDVMEFLLNVKALRLEPLSGQPGKLMLEAHGEKRVCASDIRPSTDFEIVNPDLCLVTLTSPEAKLSVEFDVELGTGYRTAGSSGSMPVGTIPVDAVFTPIRKVNFTVEPMHIGQEISRERLYLEVWTDGTIAPTGVLSQAATIIMQQLAPFAEFAKVSQMKTEERLVRLAIPDEKYNMTVEQLDLSVRTMNCLRRGGITTVGQILAKGPKELLKLRNFGQKSFQEIEERLAVLELSFPSEKPEEKGEGVAGETAAASASVETGLEAEKPDEK